MFDNGLTEVQRRIWFVNAPLRSAHYIERAPHNDDELFRIITDDLGVGSATTIIFDPRVPGGELRFYENGLASPDECESGGLSEDVTVEGIFEAIDRIHSINFVTPSGKGGLWSKPARWRPKDDAELRIQAQLKSGLAMRYRGCDVRPEQPGVTGRLDLVILQRDPLSRSILVEHAVIELKVLRSFGQGGAVVPPQHAQEWLIDGVTQAASYRDERGSRYALLACFDMRRSPEGEASLESARDEAKVRTVALRAWIIFASAKIFREYLRQHPAS